MDNIPIATREQYLRVLFADDIAADERTRAITRRWLSFGGYFMAFGFACVFPPALLMALFVPRATRRMTRLSTVPVTPDQSVGRGLGQLGRAVGQVGHQW